MMSSFSHDGPLREVQQQVAAAVAGDSENDVLGGDDDEEDATTSSADSSSGGEEEGGEDEVGVDGKVAAAAMGAGGEQGFVDQEETSSEDSDGAHRQGFAGGASATTATGVVAPPGTAQAGDGGKSNSSATTTSAMMKKPPSLSTLAQAAAHVAHQGSVAATARPGDFDVGANSSSVAGAAAAAAASNKASRSKLSVMRKLPTLANRKTGGSASAGTNSTGGGLPHKKRMKKNKAALTTTTTTTKKRKKKDKPVKATIVRGGGSNKQVDAVAEVVATATKGPTNSTLAAASANKKSGSSKAIASSSNSSKRRPFNPTKAVRMPLIASPGLLMAPPSSTSSSGSGGAAMSGGGDKPHGGGGRGGVGGSGSGSASSASPYVTPASVFDAAMKQAGYTVKNRTEMPHRGSSVTRTVGDMFDSDCILSLRFPRTVPPHLLLRGGKNNKLRELQQPQMKKQKLDHDAGNGSAPTAVGVDDKNAVAGDGAATSVLTSNATFGDEKKSETGEAAFAAAASLRGEEKKTGDNCSVSAMDTESPSLPELLIKALSKKSQGSGLAETKKRKRPWKCSDMVPVSLTVPYPEEYLSKRVQYVRDVEAREMAIVSYQEAVDEAEIAMDSDDGIVKKHVTMPSVSMIPPIPEPPAPPRVQDLAVQQPSQDSSNASDHENKGDSDFGVDRFEEDRHPFYPPRGKDNFIAHLDPTSFHISEGRYFGLYTNTIADPNFVGPNAPGLSGVHASGGSGLATSTTGGGISGAMALALSTTYNGTTASTESALKSALGGPAVSSAVATAAAATATPLAATKIASKPKATTNSGIFGSGERTISNGTSSLLNTASITSYVAALPAMPPNAPPPLAIARPISVPGVAAVGSGVANSVKKTPVKIAKPASAKKPSSHLKAASPKAATSAKSPASGFSRPGSTPTASAADLKRIMDGDDAALKASFRDCIIKAAVHGSRSGRHGQSFRGPNGRAYPDASKAFSVHGGIRPCERCKSNKQGAYHCRLRRRHKQPDYDGGDSPGLLAPLFSAPMESLLCKKKK